MQSELQPELSLCFLFSRESTGGSDACAIVASSSAGNDSDDDGMQVEVEEKDSRTEAVTELDDEIDRLYMAGYDDDEPEGQRVICV